MKFQLWNVTFLLPSLFKTVILIIFIVLLIKWSNQLETQRFTIFFYFAISTYIAPIFFRGTKDGVFQLWVPLGFIIICLYLYRNKRYHPAKLKASLLGFSIAIYQLILQYIT